MFLLLAFRASLQWAHSVIERYADCYCTRLFHKKNHLNSLFSLTTESLELRQLSETREDILTPPFTLHPDESFLLALKAELSEKVSAEASLRN